jgi:predicted lipid-binding transport protein (Tim44 family)
MRARIGDVVAGSGATLMAVTLAGMVLDLSAGVVPGAPLTMGLCLGLLGLVAALVRRFEQASAQQPSSAQSLQEIRQRRADLVRRQQAENRTAQASIAA